jgi:hypothetical protein
MIRHFFYSFCTWSDHTALAESIRHSVWLFPAVEIFHLLGLGILGGIILLWNFRLLGVPILQEESLPDLVRSLWPLMMGSLIVMLISGYALFSSEAMKDFFNWGFRLKMGALLLAMIFTFTIHRRIASSNEGVVSPLGRKSAAIMSLLLWLTVGLGGRSIGYITGYTQ